jgi:hypothetical protein
MGKVRESFATMAPALGRVKNSFQNAYAWYLAAAMYEAQADRPNAYIAYKKAHELAPDNPHLRRDLMRLAATESPDELAAFSTAFDLKPDCCPQPAAEVIVVVEEGWISRRQSVKLPIPVGYSIQSLTFPTYFDQPYTPMALDVQIDGAAAGQVAPLCFLQSLAYHDLREKMPGILLRNLTRGTARGVAQKQMMDSRNVWIKAASLALSAGTAVTDQGDTRSWTSLPMAVQLFRAPVEPGSRAIRLVNRQTGQAQDISVDVAAGELKLVWMADLAARSVVSVASLTGKGATAALAQHDGLGGSVGAPGVSTPADAPVVSADAPSALAGAAAPTPPIETADPIADTPAAVQPSAPPTGGLPAHAARIQAGAVPLESAPRGNGSGRPVQSGGRARVTVF